MTPASDEGFDLRDPRPLPPGQRLDEELRINHYGRVPRRLDLETWSLTIGGATHNDEEFVLRWPDLQALPQTEVLADHHCASKHSTLDLRWGGVLARDVLELHPPADDAPFAMTYASYGYSTNVTIDDLMSPRVLFATHLGGEPLLPEHGWPVRLILPHLYGYKGPKWVVAIEYLRHAQRGFWEQRGYHFTGDVWRQERYAHQE